MQISRSLKVFLRTIVLAALVLGQMPACAQAAAWKMLSSGPGRFSVLMPGTPKIQKTTEKDQDGTTTHHEFTLETPTNFYMVQYFDTPADVARLINGDALMEEMAGQFLKGLQEGTKEKFKVLSKRRIWLQGHAGRESSYGTQGLTMTLRTYWVHGRIYMLVAGPTTRHDRSAARFLRSFKLRKS